MASKLQYRVDKRLLANYLLSKMPKQHFFDPNYGGQDYERDSFTINKFWPKHEKHSYEQIESALELLKFNEHVTTMHPEPFSGDDNDVLFVLSHKGSEAYNEGFYEKENVKDKLEERELVYRRWLPLASLFFSLVAFFLSLYSFFHPALASIKK